LAAHTAALVAATMAAPYLGQAPTLSTWLTFDSFLARFKTRWILSNNRMEVIAKITKMKQMGSVVDYNYDTGLNDMALIPYYRMGLKPAREKWEHLQSEGKCFHCKKEYEPGYMCQKKREAQKKWSEHDHSTNQVGELSNDQMIPRLKKEMVKLQKQVKANESNASRFKMVEEESDEDEPKKKATKLVKRKWPKKKVESDANDKDMDFQ
jgi:hypothetical protein